ncbi:MAG: LamG domain-containing protein [Lachnospiraceae bacterium]|nr:LamG domain-containing protein [Lachnospiraceae bacterium]
MTYPYQYFYLKKSGNDVVSVPLPSGVAFDPAKEFSIDAWIRLPDVTTNKCILSQNGVFSFFVCEGELQFRMEGFSETARSREILSPNEWYYVAVTCYRHIISLFVDAQDPADTRISGSYHASSQPLTIGKDFFGEIRQVRIYSHSLTYDEIRNLRYEMGLTDAMNASYDFTCFPPKEQRTKAVLSIGDESAILFAAPSAVYMPGDYLTMSARDSAAVNPGGALDAASTVQQWVYFTPRQDSSRYTLFSNTDFLCSAGMEMSLIPKENRYYLQVTYANFQEQDNTVLSLAPIPENQWVNVAAVYENSTLCLYINGKQDVKRDKLKPAKCPLVNRTVQIGAGLSSGGNGGNCFSGCISRTDVWNKALSEKEIAEYMNEEPEQQENLCASWSMFMRTVINSCDGSPLVRVNELHIADLTQKAVTMCGEIHQPMRRALLPEPLSREELEKCRDAFFKKLSATEGTDTENMLSQSMVASYRKEDTVYFILHEKAYSHTISSLPADMLGDELEEWRVEVILNIVSSLLDLFLSVHIAYNPRLASFILDSILSLALVRTAFAMVKDNDRSSAVSFIFKIVKILFSENRIITLIKLAVQISFWGFATMVAKLTAKMVSPWAYLAVWSTSLAAVILVLFLRKPKPNPRIAMISIAFHHGVPGLIDSIDIRKNAREAWLWPEWYEAIPETSPAVYRLSSFAAPGSQPSLIVRLAGEPGLTGTFPVRGIMVASGGNLLGTTATVQAAFVNGNLVGEFVAVSLPNHRLQGSCIQKTRVGWRWEYQNPENGEWIAMRTTYHTVYTILGSVNVPWRSSDAPSLDFSRPWTDVLDFLQPYVQGLQTREAVMSALVHMIYERLGLTYSGGAGWALLANATNHTQTLSLHDFMTRDAARENTVNCQDCAALVAAFANILGCNMRVQLIQGAGGVPYHTGKMLLVGEHEWRLPNSESKGPGFFDYHFVAVPNTLGDSASGTTMIYDACMKFNGASDPWADNPRNPQLACGIPFSRYPDFPQAPLQTPVLENSYREHTCANTADGIGSCALIRRYMVTLWYY